MEAFDIVTWPNLPEPKFQSTENCDKSVPTDLSFDSEYFESTDFRQATGCRVKN